MILTNCKDCVFAQYEGVTQTDCELGRLAKFDSRKNGKVIEAYDNDREFFILDDIKCNAYTNQKHININNVYNYLQLPILFLIYQDKHNTVDQLYDLIESAYASKYKKLKIAVRYNGNIKEFAAQTLRTIDLAEDKKTISYDYTIDPNLSFAGQINNSVEKDGSRMCYIIAKSGEYTLDQSLFDRINRFINIHLESFAIITNGSNNYNGMIVNYQYHKYCLGFGEEYSILDKANQILSKEDFERLVLPMEKFNEFK